MSAINFSATITNNTSSAIQLSSYGGCSQPQQTIVPGATCAAFTATSNFQVKGQVSYATADNTQSFVFDFYIPVIGGNSFDFTSNENALVADLLVGGPGFDDVTVQVLVFENARVSLASDCSNSFHFVDSMFYPGVRGAAPVFQAASGTNVGFADQQSIQTMVAMWQHIWLGGSPPQSSLQSDASLLSAIASYVKTNTPILWVPQIAFSGWSGPANASPPVYTLFGYTPFVLWDGTNWNFYNLTVLLSCFAYGAHFVVIQDPGQPGVRTVPDFFDYMADNLGSNAEQSVWESHYQSIPWDTGMSYPVIVNTNNTPDPSPLVCAFLVGPTVQPLVGTTTYNADSTGRDSFFQLEGWRQLGESTSGRHNADYASYNATLWNFSTYGACAYSEKRGTALFLAPPNWPTPVPNPNTIMPPYAGAITVQGWLNTALVTLGAVGTNLWFIKTQSVASGSVEVHERTAVSNYQSGVDFKTSLVPADADNGWFQMVFVDLWFIKTKNAASGWVEVHQRTAVSDYQTGIEVKTGLGLADADNGSLQMVGADLWFIKTKNAASGFVEVHQRTAASGYKTGIDSATSIGLADADNGSFQMVGSDLWFIKTKNAASGWVEVHQRTAASTYQKGIDAPTSLSLSDASNGWFDIA